MVHFITAFLFCLLLTPLVIQLAKYLSLVDDPKKRYHPASVHEGVVPRAGGLAIYLAIVLTALILIPLSKPLIGIIIGGAIIVTIGLWDDYQDLSPYFRLITNIAAALCVVGFGAGIPFITNPLGGVIRLDSLRLTFEFFGSHSIIVFSTLVGVIWIVWMMNIIGWSAGVDGQLPGFVAISSFVIALLSNRFIVHDPGQIVVLYLALTTTGAFLGFLPWNFYPQKIMPGYGGKSLAGFLLASLAILSGAKVGTAVLVLGIPVIDSIFTIVRRIVSGKSPFKPDKGHLHHHLLSLGWGKRRIALFYWSISAVLGVVALTFDSTGKVFAFVLVGIFLIFGLMMLQLLNFFRILR